MLCIGATCFDYRTLGKLASKASKNRPLGSGPELGPKTRLAHPLDSIAISWQRCDDNGLLFNSGLPSNFARV